MKCDDCLNLFEEYIDGEAAKRDAEQVRAHLTTCAGCADKFETMTAEQEIYSRYDRELEISPATWNSIAARTAAESRTSDSSARSGLGAWLSELFSAPRYGLAGAMAVLILGVVLGVVYLRTSAPPAKVDGAQVADNRGVVSLPRDGSATIATGEALPGGPIENGLTYTPASYVPNKRLTKKAAGKDQSDVLFPDIAYSRIEEKDTAEHIAQAQNLMRSIRNIQLSDSDEAVDVTYEKAMSRRLLSENQVLRADAEASGKFPVKALLSDLEPFLIDIANLPDKTTPSDLRVLKDRVQKTEIVAALQSY